MPGMQSPTLSHNLALYFVLLFYPEIVDQAFLGCTVFLLSPKEDGVVTGVRHHTCLGGSLNKQNCERG